MIKKKTNQTKWNPYKMNQKKFFKITKYRNQAATSIQKWNGWNFHFIGEFQIQETGNDEELI